jgi:hypothetical protein
VFGGTLVNPIQTPALLVLFHISGKNTVKPIFYVSIVEKVYTWQLAMSRGSGPRNGNFLNGPKIVSE